MIENRKILHLIESFDDAIDEFEEVVHHHPAQARGPLDTGASLFALMEAATTMCLPIDEEVNATLCLACDHFVGCHRDASGELVVHCWTHKRKPRLARGTETMTAPLKLE